MQCSVYLHLTNIERLYIAVEHESMFNHSSLPLLEHKATVDMVVRPVYACPETPSA